MKRTKYIYIIAWGRYLGSTDHRIQEAIDKAEAEDAPFYSLFYLSNKGWQTIDRIGTPWVKAAIIELANQVREERKEPEYAPA